MLGVALLAALTVTDVGDLGAHGLQVSSDLNLQASALLELRAGEMPIDVTKPPQAFVAAVATPLVGLELRQPTSVFAASYAPRIFWEDPNAIGVTGPLILHNVLLSLNAQQSRRITITGGVTGSFGKPDYNALAQALGSPVQGTIPQVETIASVSGALGMKAQLTKLWLLGVEGQIFYWKWLNATPTDQTYDTGTGTPILIATRQTALSGTPSITRQLSNRDDGIFATSVAYASYSTGVQALTVTPMLSWRTRLTREETLKLSLGVTYVDEHGNTLLVTGAPSNVFPVGSAQLAGELARRQQLSLEGLVAIVVEDYLDPVLQVATPRADFTARLALTALPSWTVGIEGDFGTALMLTPLVGNPDETAFSLKIPVRRRISQNFFAEVGALWADRGPILNTPGFAFHERQLWAYVTIGATTNETKRLIPTVH